MLKAGIVLEPSSYALMAKVGKINTTFKKNIGPALNKAALLVSNRAKELAPVDTGLLRSSISVFPAGSEVGREGEAYFKIAGVSLDTVPYAEHVEFMGSLQSPKSGRTKGQMPYLRPAYLEKLPEIKKILKELVYGPMK